jgi:hypothetical protein
MPIRTARLATIVVAALALLPACSFPSKQVGQRTRADESIVVVYIDLSRSPSYWRKTAILCDDGKGGKPWWTMHTDREGLYYQEGAPVGRCWLTGGFQDGITTRIYKLPETADKNPTTVAIRKPGVTYMGSFRYQPRGDDFELVPTKAVSEKEALRRVLPFTEGTGWSALVKQRLSAL